MKYIINKRYFFPYRLTVAALLAVSGLLTTYIGIDHGIVFPLVIGLPLLGIGLILLILGIVTRLIKGERLDRQITEIAADMPQRARDEFGLAEDTEFLREPMVISGFLYNTKDAKALAKTEKDGVPRTNIAQAIALLFGTDTLYWYDQEFSLVFDKDQTFTKYSVKYADIASAALEDTKVPCESTRMNTLTVMCKTLKLTLKDGLVISGCFLKNNPDIAPALAEIKARMKAAKKA